MSWGSIICHFFFSSIQCTNWMLLLKMFWIKNPVNSTIAYHKCCRVRRFQNFIHQFCVCQGFSWLQDLLLISRWWWWDGQKLRPSFRVGIISETHCSTGLESWLTNFFLGIIWKMCSSGVKSSPRPLVRNVPKLEWPQLWSWSKVLEGLGTI